MRGDKYNLKLLEVEVAVRYHYSFPIAGLVLPLLLA